MFRHPLTATEVIDAAHAHANQALGKHWRRLLSPSGGLPSYAAFNANTLVEFADHLMVIEPTPTGDFHFVYYGSNIGSGTKTDMTGRLLSELVHPVCDELAKCFHQVLAEGAPLLVTHGQVRSAAVHTWEQLLLPVEGPMGRRIVGQAIPIVSRSDLLESILQSSPSAILACQAVPDPEQRDLGVVSVVMANQSAARLFCRSHEELVGAAVVDLIPEADRERFIEACREVVRTAHAGSLTLRLSDKPESPQQDLSLSPYDGGIVLTFTDLGVLRRTYDDLDKRESDLARALQALDQQSRLLQELAQEIHQARRSYDLEVGERRRLEEELRRQAETDELTGLQNRRSMLQLLKGEVQRSARYGHVPALLYLDIDNFKSINDTHGHVIGDVVIRAVAERIVSALRDDVDRVGRLGGDEFAVLLPETAIAGAMIAAERIRQSVAFDPIDVDGQTLDITVSIGIATWNDRAEPRGGRFESVEGWLARADEALYTAKRAGRNTTHPSLWAA